MSEDYNVRYREDPQASHGIRVSYPPTSCTYLFTHEDGIIDTSDILSKSHGYNQGVPKEKVPVEVIKKLEEEGYEFDADL